jgi:hypothetical protein
MNKILKKLWSDLLFIILQINEHDTSETIFHKLADWYQKNKKFFSPNLIDKYQLERLINVDTKNYPLERSECTPQSIKNLRHINPSSEDSMLSLFSDKLWELVILRTDDECQICHSSGMFALFDIEAKTIVLECSVCYCIQTLDGNLYKSLTPITWRLAQNQDSKIAGLI